MSLLDAHLEQISLCSASIAELPFPGPKIFTNALLRPHDITTLIRDTEPHERALFSVPPPPAPPRAQDPSARRNTTVGPNGASAGVGGGGANAMRAPRRNTAVAAVLGGDLVERIRRGGGGGAGTGVGYGFEGAARERGEVDVEVLLEGASKLCSVYPMPGAAEKIVALRNRHHRLAASIEHYELKVAEQAAQLSRMNRHRDFAMEEGEDDAAAAAAAEAEQVTDQPIYMSEEDLKREEEEIKELERKKHGLEDRVSSMGRDITGVLR
ncbi:DASH complex subunit Spc34 [Lineolata rhizophorae]|uniref:DASH complex subunit SPC34 n=1 Tax=Lineolata rhizophorae TaxID=578093 RepID=A0A6A6NUY4_9PEZI|nr:DASH complex subunit Spc34 [Lineolata rhizophorae]